MATTLWNKVKHWFSTPGGARAVPGMVLRSADSEAAPPGAGAGDPAPAATRPKPESPTPGGLAAAQHRAVKACTVYTPGQVIARRYAVERVFEGGMGYVYIARDKTQNLRFAIKQPKEAMLRNRDFFARMLREADAWTGLGMHPHIAYCYFVRSLEAVPHIFVEYVDGGTLKEWIEDGQCLDCRVGLELAIQCCQGMERAHSRGLLHRDLKPANLLVTKDGQLKVTDFGLVGAFWGRFFTLPEAHPAPLSVFLLLTQHWATARGRSDR
jgi:serine/threonine protein kinase